MSLSVPMPDISRQSTTATTLRCPPMQASSSSLTLNEGDPERVQQKQHRSRSAYLLERDIRSDGVHTISCLLFYAFNAGYLASVGFSATSLWLPFQTGNTIILALAAGEAIVPGQARDTHDYLHATDRQALTSLLAFAAGGLLIQTIPTHWRRKRMAHLLSGITQVLLTLMGTVFVHLCNQPTFFVDRNSPSWSNGYGFAAIAVLSASCGLQGVSADVLATPVGVSVVLTSLWVQVTMQPMSIWKQHAGRDQKALAIVCLFLGAFVGRILTGAVGSVSCLAIITGLRAILTLLWTVAPVKPE